MIRVVSSITAVANRAFHDQNVATVAAAPAIPSEDRYRPAVMDAQAKRSHLLDHPLLRDVRTDRLERILDGIAVKQVRRGTQLNTPAVTPGLMYLVLSGRLRAYQVMADGHELLLELIPEGGFDGLLSVAGKRGHFTEADEDSIVASLALPTLERLISLDPRVAMNLMQLIVERLEGREEHLEAIVLHDPTQRLARQLVALGETLGRKHGTRLALTPRITHQMLADMLGVRRETVTLHLGRLTELGAVGVEKRRLLLDPALLKKVVDDPDFVRRHELK
jgi:CRP/FNR family cyclic AMP-dependent transcriptional regulator